MFLTVRFFSLVLAVAAALPAAGCSLERVGSADDPRVDDDAPTTTDPDPIATGKVESDGGMPTSTTRPDAGSTPPAPSLQTDAGSPDTPKTPSAETGRDAGVEDASAPTTPIPPTQPTPEPPTQPEPPPPPTPPTPPTQPTEPTPPTQPTPEPPTQPPVFGFTLRSVDFVPDGALPQQFTCDGPSPQFSWQNAPSGVRSYALTLEQLDYRSSTSRLLWAMTNIPAGLSSLPRGYSTERGRFQAPVCGGSQRYTYTLYALSQGASVGTGVQSVTRTVRGGETVFQPSGVIGTATLVGYFNP